MKKTIGVILIVWAGYWILVGNADLWLWAVLSFAIAMVMDKGKSGRYLRGRMDYYNSGR